MARARNIKPGFYKNEDLAECSVWARLMFPGLWMLADREGRLEDRPKRIKGELFPFDSVEVDPLLDELTRFGMIRRYVVGDLRVIQVVNFARHQAPHGKEADSAFPDEHGAYAVHKRAKNGCVIAESGAFVDGGAVNPEKEPIQHSAGTGQAPDQHCASTVLAHPDSLNPSSLNPESFLKSSVVTCNSVGANENLPTALAEPDALVVDRAVEVAKLLRGKGIDATPAILRASNAAEALNQPNEDWLAAAEKAVTSKQGERVGVSYLLPIMADFRALPHVRASPGRGATLFERNRAAADKALELLGQREVRAA